MIGFRLGDLHVRRQGELIRVGGGTTKKDQVDLFVSLFDKYGKVYVGKRDKRGAWHPEVSLNNTFAFLVPKHKRILGWIMRLKENFVAFFAGYTDAEGNIGCYPRARLKITSYDYGILKDIARQIKKYFNISPKFFLEKTNKTVHNQDALSLTINDKSHLITIFENLKPFLRHKNRRKHLAVAVENIRLRNSMTWKRNSISPQQ